MNRSNARVIALSGQAVAVLAAAGVGWILLTGVPGSSSASAYDPTAAVSAQPVVEIPGTTAPADAPWLAPEYEIDIEGVAARLALVPNAPTPPEAPDKGEDTTTADAGDTTPDQADGLETRVKYLGLIRSGDRRLALLSIDGSQRVMESGERLPGVEGDPALLANLSDNAVRIRQGREMITIQLAQKTGPDGSSISGEPAPAPAAATGDDAPPLGTSQFATAEQRKAHFERRRERIREAADAGRITPQAAERLLRNLDREEERGTVTEQMDRRGRLDVPASERAPRQGTTFSRGAARRRADSAGGEHSGEGQQ